MHSMSCAHSLCLLTWAGLGPTLAALHPCHASVQHVESWLDFLASL